MGDPFPRIVNAVIPDDSAYNPLAHLNELADGDYPSGRVLDAYYENGTRVDASYTEILVIKNHQAIGLKYPSGNVQKSPLDYEIMYTMRKSPNIDYSAPI